MMKRMFQLVRRQADSNCKRPRAAEARLKNQVQFISHSGGQPMNFSLAKRLQRTALLATAPLVFVPVLFSALTVLAQQQQQQQQAPPADLSRPNGPNVIDPNQNKNKPDAANAPVPGTPGKAEAPPPPLP
jgi:hypothetical protein